MINYVILGMEWLKGYEENNFCYRYQGRSHLYKLGLEELKMGTEAQHHLQGLSRLP